jgi:RNA polymerase sigma factor (TIGR02999 family)
MPHPAPSSQPEAREATTALLNDLAAGKEVSAEALFPLVYDELRRVAHRYLHGAPPGQTLTTIALVHEVYLRLVRQERVSWEGRAHFLGVAARAMRSILIEHARARARHKRGGGQVLLDLDAVTVSVEEQASALLALDEALDALSRRQPRLGRIVELRFFGGMMHEEIAALLGVGVRTVERDWQRARAYLRVALT